MTDAHRPGGIGLPERRRHRPDGERPRPASGEQFVLRRGPAIARIGQVAAVLREYAVDGVRYTETWPDPQTPPMAAGVVLMPWPNRVAGARWRHGETTLQLDVTEPAAGNAIHGLLRNTAYQRVQDGGDGDGGAAGCGADGDGAGCGAFAIGCGGVLFGWGPTDALAFGSMLSAMKNPSASMTSSQLASLTLRSCGAFGVRTTSRPRKRPSARSTRTRSSRASSSGPAMRARAVRAWTCPSSKSREGQPSGAA